MQNVQQTRCSSRPAGERKQFTVFLISLQRDSQSAPKRRGGGMLTSKKEESQSEG